MRKEDKENLKMIQKISKEILDALLFAESFVEVANDLDLKEATVHDVLTKNATKIYQLKNL